jgi:MYXO-CTERM domain-containing protein
LLLGYFGQTLFDLMTATPPSVWLALVLGAAVWAIRRRCAVA